MRFRSSIDNLKNLPGWRTSGKVVAFSVDDYGNVRLASRSARDRMEAKGVPLTGRFDHFDTMETRQDIEALLDVLSSVKGSDDRSAIFTPYSLSANLDFDATISGSTDYRHEALPDTFERLATKDRVAYEGAWDIWREGMHSGLLRPQFHGREHLNVALIEQKLRCRDKSLVVNIEHRSMAGLEDDPSRPGVGFTHAFGLWDRSETARHREIIKEGLTLFERVFGFRSVTFTPPAQKLHPDLYPFVEDLGIRGIDKPLTSVRRIDQHRSKREVNFLGQRRRQRHVTIVRNVVFEPTADPGVDSVALALRQVEAAFRWRKPAIISSHRVNFCGHIDEANRRMGLNALRELLTGIVARWPDVRFVGVDELVDRIAAAP